MELQVTKEMMEIKALLDPRAPWDLMAILEHRLVAVYMPLLACILNAISLPLVLGTTWWPWK